MPTEQFYYLKRLVVTSKGESAINMLNRIASQVGFDAMIEYLAWKKTQGELVEAINKATFSSPPPPGQND